MMKGDLCPGTAVAALGERNRRALAGILGMTFGLQAETYGLMAGLARSVDLGPLTWPALLAVSPWAILAGLAVASVVLFIGLEVWERRRISDDGSKPPSRTAPLAERVPVRS